MTTEGFVLCGGERQEVLLRFPFSNLAAGARARVIAGYRRRTNYQGHDEVAVYPFWSLPAVVAFADANGIPVGARERELAASIEKHRSRAVHQVREERVRRSCLPQIRIDEAGRLIVDREVDSETPQFEQALKEINYDSPTWDPQAAVHVITHRRPEEVEKLLINWDLVISDEAQRMLEAELERQERNFAASWAATGKRIDIPGLDPSVELRDMQWAGINWLVEMRRTFEGSVPGVGKSLEALCATAVWNAYPLIVVCLTSLRDNWVREIARFPDLNVYVAKGRNPKPIPPKTDVIVIGTDVLGYTPDRRDAEVRTFPWIKALLAVRPKALILDEGHLARRESANRTQALLQLSKPIIERDGLVYNLTGTAMESGNHIDLGTQLEIIGRIDDFGGPGPYRMRYCAGKRNSFGHKFTESHHANELFFRLRAYGIFLRRTDMAALGLPGALRQHEIRVSHNDLDRAAMRRYREAEAEFMQDLRTQVFSLAAQLGDRPDGERVRLAMRKKKADHLRRLTKLAEIVGEAKLPYAKRLVKQHVHEGEKVVVAAHHREITAALAEAFGGLRIVGEQTVESRERDKYVFQNNPHAKVITLSAEAGGLGHTLTAARIGIAAELTWKASDLPQVSGRLYRLGQEEDVDFYVLLAENTIDEQKYQVLQDKKRRNDAVLDGRADGDDVVTGDEESIAAEVAWMLAMRSVQGYGGRA